MHNPKMNPTKLVTIICWIAVAAILIGLAIWLLTGNLFGFRTGFQLQGPSFNIGSLRRLTGPFNEVGAYEAVGGEIDSIEVNWVAGTVTIEPYDGEVVKVTEYAQRSLEEDEKFVCGVSGGTLGIKYCTPGLNTINITKRLEVLIPEALADKLDVLDVDATSAEVTISDLSVNTFNIKETSGDTEISNINAQNIGNQVRLRQIIYRKHGRVKAGSGARSPARIDLSGVTADSLKAKHHLGGQKLTVRSNPSTRAASRVRSGSQHIDPGQRGIGKSRPGINGHDSGQRRSDRILFDVIAVFKANIRSGPATPGLQLQIRHRDIYLRAA